MIKGILMIEMPQKYTAGVDTGIKVKKSGRICLYVRR